MLIEWINNSTILDAEGHVMLLLVKRKNNDVFKFVPLYANEANPNTKFLWNTFVNGVRLS